LKPSFCKWGLTPEFFVAWANNAAAGHGAGDVEMNNNEEEEEEEDD
jgi:hypothetical protein